MWRSSSGMVGIELPRRNRGIKGTPPPEHWRRGPRRVRAWPMASKILAPPELLLDQNQVGPGARRCCRIPVQLGSRPRRAYHWFFSEAARPYHEFYFSSSFPLFSHNCRFFSNPTRIFSRPLLNPIPCTLYPISYTLYPIPYTLYPIPYTLYLNP